jgi:hypothetical protein
MPAASTLMPEDRALAPVAEDASMASTSQAPSLPDRTQSAACKGADEAACRSLPDCAWVDSYTVGPGVSFGGYCGRK